MVVGYYENMRHYLKIDGKSTIDFGVYLSGNGTFKAPEKTLEEFTIPGRNGTFHYKVPNTYKNVKVPYECFIFKDFRQNIAAFRSFLLSRDGYVRIEDSHHPEEYRMGIYHNEFDPDVFVDLTAAQFTIEFDCKPERFLKSGEKAFNATPSAALTLINPTNFIAKPLLRCYGSSGSVTVNGIKVSITGVSGYADLDCEIQETIPTSLNSKTTLNNGEFPSIKPGSNSISCTGFSRVEVYPRWWIL